MCIRDRCFERRRGETRARGSRRERRRIESNAIRSPTTTEIRNARRLRPRTRIGNFGIKSRVMPKPTQSARRNARVWSAATYPWVHEGHPRKLGDRNIADVEHHDSLAACFALELRDAVCGQAQFGALGASLSVVGASSRLRFLSRLRAGAGFCPAATLRPRLRSGG